MFNALKNYLADVLSVNHSKSSFAQTRATTPHAFDVK